MNKHIPEKKCDKYEFAKGDVFGLDVYLCSGDGKAKLTELRTTVFKRALENTYMLKSKAAREFFSEVNTKFPSLPFSIRAFEDVTIAKLGVKHCVDHELLEPFEVHTLKEGEICVSFKATVGILGSGTTSILSGNSAFDASQYATSKKVEDAELAALLELNMDLKEQKKRKKADKRAAGEGEEKPTEEA